MSTTTRGSRPAPRQDVRGERTRRYARPRTRSKLAAALTALTIGVTAAGCSSNPPVVEGPDSVPAGKPADAAKIIATPPEGPVQIQIWSDSGFGEVTLTRDQAGTILFQGRPQELEPGADPEIIIMETAERRLITASSMMVLAGAQRGDWLELPTEGGSTDQGPDQGTDQGAGRDDDPIAALWNDDGVLAPATAEGLRYTMNAAGEFESQAGETTITATITGDRLAKLTIIAANPEANETGTPNPGGETPPERVRVDASFDYDPPAILIPDDPIRGARVTQILQDVERISLLARLHNAVLTVIENVQTVAGLNGETARDELGVFIENLELLKPGNGLEVKISVNDGTETLYRGDTVQNISTSRARYLQFRAEDASVCLRTSVDGGWYANEWNPVDDGTGTGAENPKMGGIVAVDWEGRPACSQIAGGTGW